MRQISSLEPTRYEITARHPDGREFLICYQAYHKSASALMRAVRERGQTIIDKLAITDSDSAKLTKSWPAHLTLGQWRLGYTGRTQRDVANSRVEWQFIGEVQS